MVHIEEDRTEINDSTGSRFQIIMAIFIAFVTVVGAVIAWQAALLSEQASDADFSSTVAIINREQALTIGTARGYQRYRAYTAYTINRTLATELKDAEDTPEIEAERMNANNDLISNLSYIDTRFLDQDGYYDLERDFKTNLADARLENELDPSGFFDEAGRVRQKVNILIQDFIVLAIALFFFTFAETLHSKRRFLRYTLALLGLVTLVIGIIVAVRVLEWGI